jgi:serine protease
MGKSWDFATGKGVMITACAPGYYVHEEELKANLLFEYRFDLADHDGMLRVDDGKFTFHGTAAAAIMVSELNGTGTNGIAFEAKLAPLQNYNYMPDLDDLDKEDATGDCVSRAILNGKTKILIILNQTATGSSETYRRTRDLISSATDSGIIVVSSAGDASKELITEMEFDTGAIIVGALRQNGSAANFSNWGRRVTVSAVGENVFTRGGPDGKMRYFGGTAAAAAQVAGVLALAAQANPRLSPRQYRALITDTKIANGANSSVGGRIDAEAVVKKAMLTHSQERTTQRTQHRHQYFMQDASGFRK